MIAHGDHVEHYGSEAKVEGYARSNVQTRIAGERCSKPASLDAANPDSSSGSATARHLRVGPEPAIGSNRSQSVHVHNVVDLRLGRYKHRQHAARASPFEAANDTSPYFPSLTPPCHSVPAKARHHCPSGAIVADKDELDWIVASRAIPPLPMAAPTPYHDRMHMRFNSPPRQRNEAAHVPFSKGLALLGGREPAPLAVGRSAAPGSPAHRRTERKAPFVRGQTALCTRPRLTFSHRLEELPARASARAGAMQVPSSLLAKFAL